MRNPLLLVLALLSLATTDADACKCSQPELAEMVDASRLVFVGRVTDVVSKKPCTNCGLSHRHTIAVEGVWRGKPEKVVTAITGADDTSCATNKKFAKGEKLLVLIHKEERADTVYRIDMCSYTRVATEPLLAEMNRRYGTPKAR